MTKKLDVQEVQEVQEQENNVNEQGLNPVETGVSVPASVKKLKSTLVRLEQHSTSEGLNVICAVLKEGRINTKATTRSYLVAISGPEMAVSYATERLAEDDLTVLNGSIISYTSTVYSPGSIVEVQGNKTYFENGITIDHIDTIDVTPISTKLLLEYIEDKGEPQSQLMEKLLLKAFGQDL